MMVIFTVHLVFSFNTGLNSVFLKVARSMYVFAVSNGVVSVAKVVPFSESSLYSQSSVREENTTGQIYSL